jgi:hypothetical protein
VTVLKVALAVAAIMALTALGSSRLGPPAGSPWYCWSDPAGDHCSTRVPTWYLVGEA